MSSNIWKDKTPPNSVGFVEIDNREAAIKVPTTQKESATHMKNIFGNMQWWREYLIGKLGDCEGCNEFGVCGGKWIISSFEGNF